MKCLLPRVLGRADRERPLLEIAADQERIYQVVKYNLCIEAATGMRTAVPYTYAEYSLWCHDQNCKETTLAIRQMLMPDYSAGDDAILQKIYLLARIKGLQAGIAADVSYEKLKSEANETLRQKTSEDTKAIWAGMEPMSLQQAIACRCFEVITDPHIAATKSILARIWWQILDASNVQLIPCSWFEEGIDYGQWLRAIMVRRRAGKTVWFDDILKLRLSLLTWGLLDTTDKKNADILYYPIELDDDELIIVKGKRRTLRQR